MLTTGAPISGCRIAFVAELAVVFGLSRPQWASITLPQSDVPLLARSETVMSKKLIDPRLYRARGAEIAALQRAFALSDAALADKARCSASTIRNAKNSRFLRLNLLNGIAEALGGELSDIADLSETAPYRNRGSASAKRIKVAEPAAGGQQDDEAPISRQQLVVVEQIKHLPHNDTAPGRRLVHSAPIFVVLALLAVVLSFANRSAGSGMSSGAITTAVLTQNDSGECAQVGIDCMPTSSLADENRISELAGSAPPRNQAEETVNSEDRALERSKQRPTVVASAEACVPADMVQIEVKIDDTSADLPALAECEWKTKIPFTQRWIKTKGLCKQGSHTVTARVPQVTVRQPIRCPSSGASSGGKAA